MAQYLTKFSEYATGSEPSDWYVIEDTGTFTIYEDTSVEEGKYATFDPEFNDYMAYWSGNGHEESDIEIVVKLRPQDNVYTHGIRLRSTAKTEGYWLQIEDSYVRLVGSNNTLAYDSKNFELNNWYWLRLRANGNNLKAKYWDDGSPEPTNWQMEITDSTHSSGISGLHTTRNRTTDYSVVGVGTNGSTAPKLALVDPPSAPTNLSTQFL